MTSSSTDNSSPGGASSRGSHRIAAAGGGCQLAFGLRYGHNLVPRIEPPWRETGTLIHMCLAYHYAARMNPQPAWLSEKTLDQALLEISQDVSLVNNAKATYAAYQKTYSGEPWVPYAVETEYKATVGELDPDGPGRELNDEPVTCRSDLIVIQNGEHWVVDYKCSAGTWGKDRLDPWREDGEYRINFQSIVNLLVLRKRIGPSVRGFIVQRIKRKAPYDFDRHVLQIPPLVYTQTPRTIRDFVRQDVEIQAKIARGEKLTPNYSACMGRWGPCDYINLCAAESEEIRDMVFAQEFVQIGGGFATSKDKYQ